MELIPNNILEDTLLEFSGYQFTTEDFIYSLRDNYPVIYSTITDEYGEGGKGSGQYYSSKVHIAKSLSKLANANSYLTFIEYVNAPKEWGSHVIALWEYNPDKVETVRIGKSIERDISEIINNEVFDTTEKESLILSRIGQGEFRKRLISYWNACAITNCSNINLLVASHIKPWSKSNNQERIDLYNGLLLIPNMDRLFDRGFISFADDGTILISSFLDNDTKKTFDLNENMQIQIETNHIKYLSYHREYIFETKG